MKRYLLLLGALCLCLALRSAAEEPAQEAPPVLPASEVPPAAEAGKNARDHSEPTRLVEGFQTLGEDELDTA
jgi:hypothetical protein